MNALKNPFSPGAGSPPPEMVGREGILDQARILLGRIKEKRPSLRQHHRAQAKNSVVRPDKICSAKFN
jgi:hypothetical protein